MPPKAKAKARMRARGRIPPGGGALRRPAGRGLRRPAAAGEGLGEEITRKWTNGEIVPLRHLDPREVSGCQVLVIEEGTYYHQPVKVAGNVTSVTLQEGTWLLRMKLTGTQDEGILRFHTGHPDQEFRVHVCEEGCNQEVAADDLVHGVKGRQGKPRGAEEEWTRNLVKEKVDEPNRDELAELRARGEAVIGDAEQKEGPRGDTEKEKKKKKSVERGKRKKKEKKEKKAKEEKKRRKSSGSASSLSDGEVKVDGSEAKAAAQKAPKALFRGTGLDPRDRVRNRVARKARRHLKKKVDKSSSNSSGSSTSSASTRGGEQEEESIFEGASKVRRVADRYPGALCNQALKQMRATLLQEVGFQDRPNVLYPAAVAYYRQQLQKKVSGPTQRELMTLTHAVDQLLRGKAASAADTLVQRIKSVEHTASGSHWSVSQRLEILPAEGTGLTAVPESTAAQREVYQEAKARWFATFPEGKGQKGNKSQGKGRGEGKDRTSWGQERDKKGKNKGGKAEASTKKD